MNASENMPKEFHDIVIEAVKKFREENEKYGYGTKQVNEFLDQLVYVAKISSFESSASRGGEFENINTDKVLAMGKEYINVSIKVIDEIEQSKFTQGVRGYDTLEVDDFMDELVKSIRGNMAIGDIKNKKFKLGFRGYNANEVDAFLQRIADAVEGLNSIKKKYI